MIRWALVPLLLLAGVAQSSEAVHAKVQPKKHRSAHRSASRWIDSNTVVHNGYTNKRIAEIPLPEHLCPTDKQVTDDGVSYAPNTNAYVYWKAGLINQLQYEAFVNRNRTARPPVKHTYGPGTRFERNYWVDRIGGLWYCSNQPDGSYLTGKNETRESVEFDFETLLPCYNLVPKPPHKEPPPPEEPPTCQPPIDLVFCKQTIGGSAKSCDFHFQLLRQDPLTQSWLPEVPEDNALVPDAAGKIVLLDVLSNHRTGWYWFKEKHAPGSPYRPDPIDGHKFELTVATPIRGKTTDQRITREWKYCNTYCPPAPPPPTHIVKVWKKVACNVFGCRANHLLSFPFRLRCRGGDWCAPAVFSDNDGHCQAFAYQAGAGQYDVCEELTAEQVRAGYQVTNSGITLLEITDSSPAIIEVVVVNLFTHRFNPPPVPMPPVVVAPPLPVFGPLNPLGYNLGNGFMTRSEYLGPSIGVYATPGRSNTTVTCATCGKPQPCEHSKPQPGPGPVPPDLGQPPRDPTSGRPPSLILPPGYFFPAG